MSSIRKYIDIINENEISKDYLEYVSILKEKCAPWFAQTNFPAYRGIRPNGSDFFKRDVHQVRKSPYSNKSFNDTLDITIKNKNLVANRTNALFVVGSLKFAEQFGEPFVVFPIGNFNYTWSPTINDAINIPIPKIWKYKDKNAAKRFFTNIIAREITDNNNRIEDVKSAIIWFDVHDPEVSKRFRLRIKELEAKIEQAQNPKYISSRMRAYLTYKEGDPYDLLEHDPKKFDNVVQYRGDDGSLNEALISKHEIMLHCQSAYYMKIGLYDELKELI